MTAIAIQTFRDKKVGIFGLGRSGMSAARALRRGGAKLIGWDDNDAAREESALPLRAPQDGAWDEIAALVPSPGIPLRHDLIRRAQSRKIPIVGDMDLFQMAIQPFPKARIVAITGTNGKSTTAALLSAMLRASAETHLGGNIMPPALDLPLPADKDAAEIYVLELSSYQLALCERFAPHLALHLNLSPDHIGNHGSFAAYAEAKARIFKNQTAADHAIIGMGDDSIRDGSGAALVKKLQARKDAPSIMTIGEGGDIYAKEGVVYEARQGRRSQKLAAISSPALSGAHNGENAAAALAASLALGFSVEEAAPALRLFAGLPHRMEEVRRIGRIRFINDSKATNMDAAARALSSYSDIFWIAGGRSKGETLDALRPHLGRVRHAALIGEAADEIARQIGRACPWTKAASLKEAVEEAYAAASASRRLAAAANDKDCEPVVLFSPACASFDMFADFEARGDAFRDQSFALKSAGSEKKTFALAAGGTGGHLFPAEALAQELRHRGHRSLLLTDSRAENLADSSLWRQIRRVPSAAIAGKGVFARLSALFVMLRGVIAVRRLFRETRPDAVIGFGGYPSLPPLLAARLLGIPRCLHEQGAEWGRANRFLAPLADALSAAFPHLKALGGRSAIATGLPVRPKVWALRGEDYRPSIGDDPFRLLVFAGSQGAKIFGRIAPKTLSLLSRKMRARIRLTLQCRPEDADHARRALNEMGVSHKIAPFFDDLPKQIADSHLIVARAGASSVSEIAVIGRPAIFVPITGAVAHEQNANAAFFQRHGAGTLIKEEALSPQTLAARIEEAARSPERLTRQAEKAKALARALHCQDGAARLADLAESVSLRAAIRDKRRVSEERQARRDSSAPLQREAHP